MGEAEIRKRKFSQRLKASTHEQMWDALNELCTYCYEQGQRDMVEAMGVHPRISKPMIEQVKAKASEILELWNGIGYVKSDELLEKMYLGKKSP